MTCTDQSGARVDPALCPGIRPSTVQRCNLQPCPGACDAATTCLGRGSCAPDGTCTCTGGFSGPFCQVIPFSWLLLHPQWPAQANNLAHNKWNYLMV